MLARKDGGSVVASNRGANFASLLTSQDQIQSADSGHLAAATASVVLSASAGRRPEDASGQSLPPQQSVQQNLPPVEANGRNAAVNKLPPIQTSVPIQGTATTATRRQGKSDGQYVQRRKDEIRANMAQGQRTQLFTDDDTRQLDHLALQEVMNINIVDNNPRLQ